MSLKITLYTKKQCSLCDIVKAELDSLAPTFPHQLEMVDIETDRDLFSRYRFSIPVLIFGNGEEEIKLKAPISRADLIGAFRQIKSGGESI